MVIWKILENFRKMLSGKKSLDVVEDTNICHLPVPSASSGHTWSSWLHNSLWLGAL